MQCEGVSAYFGGTQRTTMSHLKAMQAPVHHVEQFCADRLLIISQMKSGSARPQAAVRRAIR